MSDASGGRPQRHNEAVPSRHSIGTDAGSVPGGAHDRLRTGWNQRNDQYLRGQRWVPELDGKAWSLGCLPERRYPSRNRGITVGVHTILHRIFSPSKNQKGFHGTVPKFGCVALYQAPMRGSNSHDSTQNESLHASETADRTRGRMHAMPQPAMRVAIDVHASAESQENTCPWNARWG